jgi:uncharacterized integral membrane protein
MTSSQPPNGERSTGPSHPPGQYSAPQYPSPQYPSPQYPAPGSVDRPAASTGPFGQSAPPTETPTIALATGPEYPLSTPEGAAPQQQAPVRPNRRPTRIGAAWVALIVAAIVLIFLLIFIVQNSGPVQIRYFGFEGTIPLGVAMLFAAVAGALTAGLLGTVKILQMRKKSRQALAAK